MKLLQTKTYTDDRIIKIIGRIKIVFIMCICMGVLIIIRDMFRMLQEINLAQIIDGIVTVILFSFLYIGLRFRKKWFIPLVLIVSTITLINMILIILVPAAGTYELFLKIFAMIIFTYSFYQMYFFSRREVKKCFDLKDKYLF